MPGRWCGWTALNAQMAAARADLRAGVAAGFEAWDVQLAWVGVQHDTSSLYDAPGYGAGAPDRSAVVLGVSYAF